MKNCDLKNIPMYFLKRNFKGDNLMVWGLFLQMIASNEMNSTGYITVLNCNLLSFLRENNKKKICFPTGQYQNSWQQTW